VRRVARLAEPLFGDVARRRERMIDINSLPFKRLAIPAAAQRVGRMRQTSAVSRPVDSMLPPG